MTKNCLNCGKRVSENYCSHCGQKTDTHRLNWHYVWHDLPHSFLHVDKGIFYTAKELTLRPGKTINDFLEGKRVVHFRPLMYLIITGTIAGLIYLNVPIESTFARDQQTRDLVIGFQEFMGRYMKFFTIGFLPFQALLTWIFYYKYRNYVEIFITLCFVQGHLSLLSILTLAEYPFQNSIVATIISWGITLLSIVYFVISFYYQFSQMTRWKRITFPILISGITSLLLVVLMSVIYLMVTALNSPDGSVYINYGF